MKITIGYLYYDLLNLYGDSGNIKTLVYHLKEQGIKVDVKYLTIGDKKDFKNIDFIYIGSGTEENILTALEDLKKDQKELEKYINNKKYILSTGNSVELFGNYIIINKKIKALGVFDYVAMHQDRIVKDVKVKTDIVNSNIIGFENHPGKILTYNEDIIRIDNFIGTYIIGPILVRNPELCNKLVNELITSKDKDFEFKETNYDLDQKAYDKKSIN
ncbi:MAG: hypothetical protein IKF36_02775 [Bacilli bacterium]|nr:hypothetical protein [Bacilli bacterium]